jgi:hypothetical protein
MATTVNCFGSAQVCAIRVARLNTACQSVAGASNAVATSAIVKVTSTPEFAQGEEFFMKNGCGQVCISSKVTDKIKRVNLGLELCTRDPALVEIISGASVITDGLDIIGYSRRGVGAAAPAPSSVEIWTKAVGVNNTCTVPGATGYQNAKWYRVIWPKATFNLSAVTFENAIATLACGYTSTPVPVQPTGPTA